jgi:N-acyl-D-amino-acid deacylase
MPTSRRGFVATSAAGLVSLAGAPALLGLAEYDLLIRNGMVYDGTGSAGRQLDIAIKGGRIAAIGSRLKGTAREEFDAKGLVVMPGFIDIHSHVDGSLDADPRAESAIRQGITTIVGGQDGGSFVPQPDRSFGARLAAIEALHPGVNVTAMIGLGSVRGAVVGDDDRPATSEELARMVAMVESALADGACGASSGLEYTPGAFASTDELIALARPLARRKLPYASHMRNEDDRLLEAIDEAVKVATGARCPLQISHLKTQGPRNWNRLDDAFGRVARARAAGIDAMFDRYPYLAYSTGLTNLFPVWSRDGGTAGFLARLDNPETAARIRTEALAKVDLIGGWDNVEITSLRAPEDSAAVGQRLGSYASRVGSDPYELTVAMLRRNEARIGMVGFAMSEDNLERILAHPYSMLCTDGGGYAIDGPTRRGSPHPRALGSYPRVLGRYVRERKVITLAQAAQKMAAIPAKRLRLVDRGVLATNMAADVLIFDADTVTDKATYEEPFQYPAGIKLVVVNGAITLRDDARTSAAAGKVLRPAT